MPGLGCISTSMPGTRRRAPAGPKGRNAKPRARSMRSWSNAMAEPPFDPRRTPARPDLAALELKGKVEATRFVAGELYEVIDAQAPLRRAPTSDAGLQTEALKGERVVVYETTEEG